MPLLWQMTKHNPLDWQKFLVWANRAREAAEKARIEMRDPDAAAEQALATTLRDRMPPSADKESTKDPWFMSFAARGANNTAPIGLVDVWRNTMPPPSDSVLAPLDPRRIFEIGIAIDSKIRGTGVSIIQAITNALFEEAKADEVRLTTSPDNEKMCAAAERAGFHDQGVQDLWLARFFSHKPDGSLPKIGQSVKRGGLVSGLQLFTLTAERFHESPRPAIDNVAIERNADWNLVTSPNPPLAYTSLGTHL